MTQKSRHLENKAGGWSLTAPLLVGLLAIAILGIFPHTQLFWAKCWLAEWAVIGFIGLVFLKNKWLKLLLLWCLFTLIRNYNFGSFVAFHYIFLFLMLYQILKCRLRKEDINKVINGLCVIILIQTAYMFLQFFGIDPIFKDNGLFTNYVYAFVQGTWGHTNLSGACLAMTLPLFFRRKWWIGILPVSLMIFLTRSLGAMVAGVCGVVFFLAFYLKGWKKFIPILLVLLTLVGYGLKFDKSQFLHTDRIQYLKPTIKIAMVRPIVGWGLGQYKFAFHAINRDVFKSGMNRGHAHFDLLQFIFETGITGGLIIIGFLLTLFVQFIKRKTRLSLIIMSGLVAGLVNSCATFIFHTPMAWIILCYLVFVDKEVNYAKETETQKVN